MAKATTVTQPKTSVPLLMDWQDMIRLLLTGAVVGLVTVALYAMLDKYVFSAVLCGDGGDAARCASKEYFGSALAMILGGVAGLFAMVQERVFRPLLVVLLVEAALWNAVIQFAALEWWLAALVAALLFGLAYLAMAWLVQLKNLYVATGLGLVLMVLVRLVLF